MRILHTEWSDGWGGQERRVVSEMAGLLQRGHHMVLVTRAACRIAQHASDRGIPLLLMDIKRKFDVRAILKLSRFLRQEHIQVVNTHSGIDSWIGGLAAKLAGTPVLVRTRHINLPLKRNWLNFVHHLPDSIVTCGEDMRRQLIDRHGFPAKQLVNIPTGIDFTRCQPVKSRADARRGLGLAVNAYVVLMVGIIRGVKRHEVALRAFHELLSSRAEAELLLAGEGPMQPEIQRQAAELGIVDKVHFLGHRQDVPDLMIAADLLLLTSRSEGVPQAVTQALGLGLPVVATAVGGVPELVIHEKTGLLVAPENPMAVAAAMRRLANNPLFAAQLGAAGRRHVLSQFGLNVMLDNTERLFEALLAKKGASQ
ncbi:MAG: glycosyltransferase family 4 protein [Sulfuricaulis sp.]